MAKKLLHGTEAREAIGRGVDVLANAVRATLGPCGRNVVIEHTEEQYPSSTKDGVTVARSIDLEDPFENMGAQMVRQVAAQTVNNAGDGTTTAVVLAQAMYKEGLKAIKVEANPTLVKAGIDLAVATIKTELKKQSQEVTTNDAIKHVGIISANGDEEIGDLIAKAMEKVGRDGVIAVQGTEAVGTKLEVTEGMQLDRGYINPCFINDSGRGECILENAYILLYEKKIAAIRELTPLLQSIYQEGRPILIIAEDVEGEALSVLAFSKAQGSRGIQSCAVKSEGYMHTKLESLGDVAAMTGGTVISESSGIGLGAIKKEHLGEAKKIIVGQHSTVIMEGAGELEDVKKRAQDIKSLQEKSSDPMEKLRYQRRLARLVSGVAVIRVGGTTEIEMSEKRDRVEDAMYATRCAVEEGVVPGGGVALVRCLPALQGLIGGRSDMTIGIEIVMKAITEPLKRIAENAGKSGEAILDKILSFEGSIGYNAKTSKFENLLETGVIDPTKVVRCALENAASVASLMLITEAMISEVRKDSEQ